MPDFRICTETEQSLIQVKMTKRRLELHFRNFYTVAQPLHFGSGIDRTSSSLTKIKTSSRVKQRTQGRSGPDRKDRAPHHNPKTEQNDF